MISKGCWIRAIASIQAYEGLRLAAWFLSEKEDEAARVLVTTKARVHEALEAELIKKEVAQRITAGIDDTVVAWANEDYEKAYDSISFPMDIAISEAMQQVTKCEFEKITKGLV